MHGLNEMDQWEMAVERKRLYGAYMAQVTDIKDPDNQGRVKVRLPWSPDIDDARYEVWARVATLMAGAARGTWFIPDPDDEVLVMFEAGDPRRPYVVGGLWNGRDDPPESMDGSGNNYKKSIVSRNDIRITLDDTDGQETLTLKTPAGQSIVIKDGDRSIEVTDASGNTIRLDPQGVSVDAASKVTVQAGQVEVTAALVKVNAGMSQFSGVVQCDTLIASTVVGATYTPGAGNIW
jgi:uncharacterized protein involved in type VI secretion and phage assembly